MITESNLTIKNNCISAINIIDILLNDIETDLIKKTFKFSINFMFDNLNIITFERIRAINKSFYTNNYFMLETGLNDLKKEMIKILKTIYEI